MSDTAIPPIVVSPSDQVQTITLTITIPPTIPTIPTIPPIPPIVPTPKPDMSFGTNTLSNDATQGASMWCDVVKQMVGWYPLDSSKKFTYGANGFPLMFYPGSVAASWTYLYGYPTGIYVLSWVGDPKALTVVGKSFTSTAVNGHNVVTLSFSTGDRVEFRATGPISQVSLLAPDSIRGRTFRDAYVNVLKPYRVVRLMPMMQTNGKLINGVQTLFNSWASRTLPSSWDQTTTAPAFEHMLQLCKESGTVPWFSVPFGCDDTYITSLANLVATYDFPETIWEHGNEYWNFGAGYQFNQLKDAALAKGIYGTDPNIAAPSYHADLTLHMGDLVKDALGASKTHVYLGAQAVYERWATYALQWAKAHPTKYPIDALAVAPYFQQIDGDNISTVSLLEGSAAQWIQTTLLQGLQKNKAVADAYGCGFTSYEAGQSFVFSPSDPVAPGIEVQWNAYISQAQFNMYLAFPKRAIQMDPAIGRLYDMLVKVCQDVGIDLFCHFMAVSNWGKSGFWGLKQIVTDVDNIKSTALSSAMTPT